MNKLTQPEKILKDHKLSVTKVRLEVLEVFREAGHLALSNQDIEEQLGKVDRITLYRTLRSFEKSGLIHQAVDGSGKTKFALCQDECSVEKHEHQHAHFHCTQCDATICLDEVDIPRVDIPSNYQLEDTQLVLTGRCAECKD
jgi:Fur family ferric uptake transcriptional regulator